MNIEKLKQNLKEVLPSETIIIGGNFTKGTNFSDFILEKVYNGRKNKEAEQLMFLDPDSRLVILLSNIAWDRIDFNDQYLFYDDCYVYIISCGAFYSSSSGFFDELDSVAVNINFKPDTIILASFDSNVDLIGELFDNRHAIFDGCIVDPIKKEACLLKENIETKNFQKTSNLFNF